MAMLQSNLLKAIRDRSFAVSIKRLRQQGHRRISALRLADIERLIAEAVDRAIEDRAWQFSDTERRGLERDAREEFQRLLVEHQRVLKEHEVVTREREELRAKYEALEIELARQQELLAQEHERELDPETVTISKEEFSDVGERIRSAVRQILGKGLNGTNGSSGDGAFLSQIEASLVQATSQILDSERQSSYQREKAAQEDRILNLERRIEKLRSHLSETEKSLDVVSRSKGIDPGIASIYRSIQGLDSSDPDGKKKKGLLDEIFKENLALKG